MISRILRVLGRYWNGIQDPCTLPMLAFVLRNRSRAPAAPDPQAGRTRAETPAVRSPRHEPDIDPACPHVPRIVYQTWKSRTDVPSNFAYWSASFRRHNPQYDCMIWDDLDNREFITRYFPWFLPFYDQYPKEIFRVDAVRYFFLYRFGGIYADMDTECLKPLDPLLNAGDAIVGRMGIDESFEHSIPNAMMASRPQHLLWLLAIANTIEKIRECGSAAEMLARGPERITGPILLKDTVDFYARESEATVRRRASWVIEQVSAAGMPPLLTGNVKVLAPALWFPVDWTNPFHQTFRQTLLSKKIVLDAQQAARVFPDSYLVTYWSHSW